MDCSLFLPILCGKRDICHKWAAWVTMFAKKINAALMISHGGQIMMISHEGLTRFC